MRRRQFLAASAVVATPPMAGCALLPARRTDYDIGMSATAFIPDTLTVNTGESVVWFNDGSRSHTVTAYEDDIPADAAFFASGGYDSERAAREAWRSGKGGEIVPGEAYTHTFTRPGRYEYFCIPHEARGMDGVVRVED